jgi:HK97 gp10 family phage protein
MTTEFKDNSKEFLDAMENAIKNGLTAIGMTAEGHAKKEITRQKAVDTGRLRNSITFATEKDAVYIGTNVEYAPYVELGTVKMPPRPYLKPAATDHKAEYEALMKAEMENA